MSETPQTPDLRTDVEMHLKRADSYGAAAAIYVENARLASSSADRSLSQIELTSAAVAVFRGQVELARVAQSMKTGPESVLETLKILRLEILERLQITPDGSAKTALACASNSIASTIETLSSSFAP